jgi:hypothetical protein
MTLILAPWSQDKTVYLGGGARNTRHVLEHAVEYIERLGREAEELADVNQVGGL